MKKIHQLNSAGLTLIEILISAVVLALAIGGFFAAMNAVRQPVINSQQSVQATEVGNEILERLRADVALGDNTAGGPFEVGVTHNITNQTNQTYGTSFNSVTYTVTLQADGSRRVDLVIN